jgi:Luciferase-like monooxygenase
VDHAGGDRHRHRTPAARPHGHTPCPPPAGQGRQETATLDRLSGGRLILGVGLGSDRFGSELSKTGEQLDDRLRGQMLDEALEILTAAWSGEAGAPPRCALHRGRRPVPPAAAAAAGVPVWTAGFPGNVRPLRRAARYDGFFPVNLEHPDQLGEVVATIADLRQHSTAPYEIAVGLPPGADPAPYAKAGATWWMPEFPPESVSLDQVRGVLREGPAAP